MYEKISLILVFATLLSGCAGASQPDTEITVELTDFTYNPSSITIPADRPVVLTINNAGQVEHDL